VGGRDGQQAIVCGVIVNHYDPFTESRSEGPLSLAQATDDIVEQVRRANPYLRATGSPQGARVGADRALRVDLAGRSPVTRQDERVSLYTRALDDDHVLYAVFVVPRAEESTFEPAFERILESLRVDETAGHR
jgi:hypothetical protein